MRQLKTLGFGAVGVFLLSVGVRAETSPSVVPPGLINGIADGADRTLIAHVNAVGELSSTDVGTRARLDQLNFKLIPLSFGDHGLRVDAAGHVAIDNLPTVQQVAGTVTVANLPAQQTVSGTVAVSNFPTNQAVTGTVAVSNLPETQNVNVVGGGLNLAPTTSSVAEFEFALINDGKRESDWLDAITPKACEAGTSCPPSTFTTTRFGELLAPGEHTITLISLVTDNPLHLTCRHHDKRVLVLATSSPTTKEFVHPLVVDECWLGCDATVPPFGSLDLACRGHYAFAGP